MRLLEPPLSEVHAMEVAKISDITTIGDWAGKLWLIVTNYQIVSVASFASKIG
jgi:hypothetical protein